MPKAKKQEIKNQIVYLDLTEIVPHPDNPRQDLGDLTELADSIRRQGIMENLVVIRNPDAVRRVALPGGGTAEAVTDTTAPRYMAVVGHRRLAAAKLAGLTTVPCVIRDMTREEAIAAMLTENGQRTALTPYEEGRGFRQLSLDMGRSVKEISEMTGFGETTIRGRLKIAELDGAKVRKSFERGATLSDMVELNRISDPALKNEVLDKAGTQNFKNELKRALKREQQQALLDRLAAEVSAFAEKIALSAVDRAVMTYVKQYSVYYGDKQTVERPEDAGERQYYYTVNFPDVSLYRRKGDDEEAEAARKAEEKAAAEAARKKRLAALTEITERHFQLRRDFVANCAPGLLTAGNVIARYAAETLMSMDAGVYLAECDFCLLAELLGAAEDIDFENTSRRTVRKFLLDADLSEKGVTPLEFLLYALYSMKDKPSNGYWWEHYDNGWRYDYRKNPDLEALYELLTALGYEESEEEEAMRTGTHALFNETPADA